MLCVFGAGVRDIQHLPGVQGCDRQAKAAAGAGKRCGSYVVELDGGERAAYGALAVHGVDGADQGRDEETEESQRQRVTNQIEEDEAAAEASHVANQVGKVAFGEVMAEVHGKGHVGGRQRVAPRVGLKNGNGCGDAGVRVNVYAYDVNPEPALDFVEDEAGGAAYIQDPAYGERIAADGADNRVGVTEPAVDSGEVPISACNQFIRNTIAIEYFSLILSYHPYHPNRIIDIVHATYRSNICKSVVKRRRLYVSYPRKSTEVWQE